ncbi:MAG TPA: hypothetical protein V6D25_05010 [Leptolyngbyaceae cyanobacterium]
MFKLLSATITVLASVAIPNAAVAAILNGGFEDGFNSWQTIGDYKVETSGFGSGTIEGNSQAFISTAYDEVIEVDANGNEIRGGNAASATFISGVAENSLDNFLNVSSFFGDDFLADAVEGSAIQQKFTAQEGQTLSFSWNFLTNESVGTNSNPDFNDFAFVTLSNSSETLYFKLADTSTEFLTTGSNTRFFEETGFKTFSYTLPDDGEYTLNIGIVDVGEPTVISGLLIDQVSTIASQATPEASSTMSLLFLGIAGAAYRLKRSQR